MSLLVTYVTFYNLAKYFPIHYFPLSLSQSYDTKQVNNILLLVRLGDTTEISILPLFSALLQASQGEVSISKLK